MPVEILMPALSPTMTEGRLANWQKKEGDRINSGEVIAEIETDKAVMEFEAVDEGILGRIFVPAGTENVAVNTRIGLLLLDDEDISVLEDHVVKKTVARTEQTPKIKVATAFDNAAQVTTSTVNITNRIMASPLAKRLAKEYGLDLAQIPGSGPNGRILKTDVEKIKADPKIMHSVQHSTTMPSNISNNPEAARVELNEPNKAQLLALIGDLPHKVVPHSTMRRTIARRLCESKQQAPHFYLTIDCDLDPMLKLRQELNANLEQEAIKLSINDLMIKACALALRRVPEANASWGKEESIIWDQVDISVAVAIEGGLITPVIRRADTKGLAVLSSEMKDLANRARNGKLQPQDYHGGTFSISNLGMFGISEFSAVINPPQGCILAIGAGTQQAVVRDGALAVATMMRCTLSVDHRVVDGSVGAAFLSALKKLIEEPISMLL